MSPLRITRFTLVSSLGRGIDASRDALRERRSGLRRCAFDRSTLDTYLGPVDDVDAMPVRVDLARYDCRVNRLAQLALEQDDFNVHVATAVQKYGADRIGAFVGTSTSGILHTEQAYRRRDPSSGALPVDFEYAHAHNTYAPADFTRAFLGLDGPAFSVAAACASSAKVFGNAARMLASGIIDAAVVGGVDSLCLTTLYGFSALELLSPAPCRPFDVARAGLSIGEAAAFAILERDDGRDDPNDLLLLGVGESSDGHHMSAPHPDGLGAREAMQAALRDARMEPGDVDYVNLHGTGTPSNDSAESRAVRDVFGASTPCSSTKGATGHTLGAAGALEASLCLIALREGMLPGGAHTDSPDPALGVAYLTATRAASTHVAVSNSFGFGGANCSLVLGTRAGAARAGRRTQVAA